MSAPVPCARAMRERAAGMRQRVLDRAAHEAFTTSDLARIDHALTAALTVRDARIDDDHDIDVLHPARTVLILLDDARMTDPLALAAAALLESVRSDLDADGGVAPRDDAALDLARRIPTPRSLPEDALLEALVALPENLLDVALAERLDHARHLHLRPRPLWQLGLTLEERVYLPLAGRRGGLVGRRYTRWHGAFNERIRMAR